MNSIEVMEVKAPVNKVETKIMGPVLPVTKVENKPVLPDIKVDEKPEGPVIPVDEMTSCDYYFDSYAHHGIHEEMLKDEVRTLTYRNSMYYNRHLMRGKVVLDIGCGTGILSMFAAKAGAARVIGIECSNIAQYAQKIVKTNGLEDTITIVQGKVEEIELPHGITQVDIIVSEWMGYCLLYESMLDTVLYARDKWLKPGGLIFPDKCSLHICGIEDGWAKREKIEWWNNVYGLNMQCLGEVASKECIVSTIDPQMIVTDHFQLFEIDLNTMKRDEVKFNVEFVLECKRDDIIHGLMTYFIVEFSPCHKSTFISTAPECPYTHWKQTVFYLHEQAKVKKDEIIQGRFRMTPNSRNSRDLDFQLEINYEGEGYFSSLHEVNSYRMR